MADFRKSLPVLALFLLLGSVANAQVTSALQCIANAGVPPLLRSEGITELTGDVVLNCNGGTPTPAGQPIPAVNIQIFLNTAVTSRLLTSAAPFWTEAMLLLDEPGTAQNPTRAFCETATGVCTNIGGAIYGTGAGQNRNIFQGQLVGTNSLLWLGVPIDPPGTVGTRVIRITNVRGNMNALGVAGANAPPTPSITTISASGATALPINNPVQTTGFIQKGLEFTLRNAGNTADLTAPVNLQQCFSREVTTAAGSQRFARLRFRELFATAFKQRNAATTFNDPLGLVPQDLPGAIYNTESGLYIPTAPSIAGRGNLAIAGLADSGTRLQARFNNVPTGVLLFVDACAGGTGCQGVVSAGVDTARAVTTATGAFSPATAATAATTGATGQPIGTVPVTLTQGSGTVVWEITDSDPLSLSTLDFGVYAVFAASPGTGSPALGTATVNGSYAPISTVTVASATEHIPRFADTSTGQNVFAINPCLTNLLFPFVTNQAGFDTGIAISSTSTDPFGTSPQSGTCTLNWFGANAPAAGTTPNIASGTAHTLLASTAAPGFQGYMIAQCRFQYAHGFAFVSDVGARNLAMGYLALIIPDRTRVADPLSTSAPGSGEQLGF